MSEEKAFVLKGGIGFTGIVAIILIFMSFKVVPANTICVQTDFGKISGYAEPGLNFVTPVKSKLICTSTAQINYGQKDGYNVSTKDMQTVDMFVRVNYAVDRAKIEDLFKSYQFEHQKILISPVVANVVQGVSSRYTIEQLVEKREEIGNIIQDEITKTLGDSGITVFNVSITNHEFSDSYEKAIEAKKVAEQNVLKAEQELLEAKIQAEKNKTISQTFTTELATKLMLEKWDGKLPVYYGAEGNALTMLIEQPKK